MSPRFFAGYLPQTSRETRAREEIEGRQSGAATGEQPCQRSDPAFKTDLVLPGSIEAITEAPILARAAGYVKTRTADIGDHVKREVKIRGTEIEAPELGHQVAQAPVAGATGPVRARSGANANLLQGKTNMESGAGDVERWDSLVARGAVARQDADTFTVAIPTLCSARESSLSKRLSRPPPAPVSGRGSQRGRLIKMQGYLQVRAPFAGVITQRNVDTGALVNEGNTLLYRIAQNDTLRTFVNVPQSDAISIHVGQNADVTIASLPSKKFAGAR